MNTLRAIVEAMLLLIGIGVVIGLTYFLSIFGAIAITLVGLFLIFKEYRRAKAEHDKEGTE